MQPIELAQFSGGPSPAARTGLEIVRDSVGLDAQTTSGNGGAGTALARRHRGA